MRGLVFIAVIAVAIAVGESLECYHCEQCQDPFRKADAKPFNCTYSDACQKVDVTLTNGTVWTTRTCASVASLRTVDSRKAESVYPASAVFNICKENLCNGATSIASTSLFLTFVSVIFAGLAINRK
ncbi:uncharacterized protein LOC107036935 [Diachasma alloeum]|uniref:uncharacterized protein LOC107036934 n=1 Tax=Diachasma alloeum TaxID=454923 RepID=UPI0007383875|nr:uncharacterized protein LOC107036934 [Diachasma alloeum]XP_015110691.1 uncharacterized protein LOC107036935 [Diachasma alloeum]